MFLLGYVLPQVKKLSKTSLVETTLYSIDDGLTPATKWVLALQDMEKSLEETILVKITLDDIKSFHLEYPPLWKQIPLVTLAHMMWYLFNNVVYTWLVLFNTHELIHYTRGEGQTQGRRGANAPPPPLKETLIDTSLQPAWAYTYRWTHYTHKSIIPQMHMYHSQHVTTHTYVRTHTHTHKLQCLHHNKDNDITYPSSYSNSLMAYFRCCWQVDNTVWWW